MEIVYLIGVGLIAGFVSSFFGVGGGIIVIPLLGLIYPNLDQHFIIATSLSIILLNGIINTLAFRKYVSIDKKIVFPIALSSIISAGLSSLVAQKLETNSLRIIFIVLLIGLILPIIFYKPHVTDSLHVKNKGAKSVLIGAISGSFSAFTGLGGGAILVPSMNLFLKMDYKIISPYSNNIMIFTALISVLSFGSARVENKEVMHIGYILPITCLTILLGTFLGSKSGIFFHKKMSSENIKKSFAALILLVILKTILTL